MQMAETMIMVSPGFSPPNSIGTSSSNTSRQSSFACRSIFHIFSLQSNDLLFLTAREVELFSHTREELERIRFPPDGLEGEKHNNGTFGSAK